VSRNDEENPDYKRLIRICQKNAMARQKALLDEILSTGRKPIELDDGTMVIESSERHPISLVAHFDKAYGSYGYNDNGMALVAILGMLDRLPSNVEVVFTNGEERGCVGAEKYLDSRTDKPIHCVNLDVCGFGDRVYLDRMNSTHLDGIKDVVNGCCPVNDAWRFRDRDIESTCVSTSYGDDFNEGIRKIFDTMHNARYDNRVDILDFDILLKVRDKVMEIIDTINADNVKTCFNGID
jgi:hypothetical protein